ncbi:MULTISPECIES: UDP-N-acetylmuramate dehydrogenase [unclassified Cryobacterium]|uniref:UDP-N-acetylmuramate dehydrogenase n=1 Tax=unclassified Cryobacterium TaxID=2649013 RepID=UPI00106961E4|nr:MULTISPECIES: UDP-N-acetylmuramate dehydrogenase [unclassified Cryobacterium]TFC51921.1 UDP-N-acetylmuramate dehydrogenase [Cryobacterium sp. TMB3-1-2]TFC68694.1 UDP-N-acetylmuramate dehydrogenase [Cryobacterium sp. TMB3-15]TFC74667.1 UDP-N-acetylmuramate dehydrogenase [Cryobacterium sp. TMB3-10]TFD44900.1 UDP-N-acetylmuramate dehydrogenase [Cryobacterium sp. TMB3-12]
MTDPVAAPVPVPVTLADLTTLRVGGAPAHLVAPADEAGLIQAALDAWGSDEPWVLLGGGSNTVAADAGFDGTVIRVCTRGVEVLAPAAETGADAETDADVDGRPVRIRVQAGEPWDDLVALTVANGWAGIEALSGIPGTSGAAPVQNIGAYGQELANSLAAIDFLDFESGEVERLSAAELGLGYRTSVLKQGRRGVVLAIELELRDMSAQAAVLGSALSQPVTYPQLANALGVQLGDRVPLAELRQSVLGLRAGKGMVLDAADPDTYSAGSFFTNPIVTESFARTLPDEAPRWKQAEIELPDRVIPLDEYAGVGPMPGVEVLRTVKLSAAWLIENSGIHRGFRLPGSGAAISSKHSLAITNTGTATADEIGQLARFVQQRVQADFGVILHPEPVFVGFSLL